MYTIHRLQLLDLSCHADTIETVVQGMLLVSLEDDGLLFLIETQYIHDHPFALGDLPQLLAVGSEEVKVVKAVFLTLHDEFGIIPGQELDGMQRLHVFVAGLTIKLCKLLTRRGIVGYQPAVILGSVQLKHIDGLAVRAPGDVREIAIGGIACLQIYRLAGGDVIDTNCHLVARHACHRVFVRLICSLPGEDVHLRIVCHHALIHPIESQTHAIRTPERAFIDTELITVYGLSIDDFP